MVLLAFHARHGLQHGADFPPELGEEFVRWSEVTGRLGVECDVGQQVLSQRGLASATAERDHIEA